jgi:hypothetical protein
VAAWVYVAREVLRPRIRDTHFFRARIFGVLLFAFVGTWAAAAPQALLTLGERLRGAFDAIAFVCVAIATTSGLRRRNSLLDEWDLPLKKSNQVFARVAAKCTEATQEILPAIPFLMFLAAVEAISPTELLALFAITALVIVAASAIANDRLALILTIAAALLLFTWRCNRFETAICALLGLHIAAKSFLTRDAIESAYRLKPNLFHEAVTPLAATEIVTLHGGRILRSHLPSVVALIAANSALILLLVKGCALPVNTEQRVALGIALGGGALLLLFDVSALLWCGFLRGLTSSNPRRSFAVLIGTILGIPWAVAWTFSALHSGEQITLNDAAAYFVLWSVLGGAISWICGANAKARLRRDLREILAES